MKVWLRSEMGMLGISIFYMIWLIAIHALSNFTGVSNLLFQILGYLPIPILAWTVFSDTLRPCLKLQYPKLIVLLIVVYAGLGIYEVYKGARIDGVLGLFFLVGPMEEVLFRGILYQRFCTHRSKFMSWLLTGIMFSFMHIGQRVFVDGYLGVALIGVMIIFTLQALFLSGLFILLFEASGTLWIPMLTHSLWDLHSGCTLVLILGMFLYFYGKNSKASKQMKEEMAV